MITTKVKPKLFKEIVGEILPDSLKYTQRIEKRKLLHNLSFDYKTETAEINTLTTEDKRMITKLGQLYGFSYMQLLNDILTGNATVENTQKFMQDNIRDKQRKVVFLFDTKKQCVNFVSERHKQVSMVAMHKLITSTLGKLEGVSQLDTVETEGGYRNAYEIKKTPLLSVRVYVDYGRNDARGKASIRFEGGGYIFVCSNNIIPYVHQELRVNTSLNMARPKLIHTLNVTEQTKKNLILLFNEAKQSALLLTEKLEESKKVEMPRELQIYCLQLIEAKHQLGNKWLIEVKERLEKEEKTLYGLSQALTYVGTRSDVTYAQKKLCEIGGQVVLLGKELVPLLEKNLKEHKIDLNEVRKIQVTPIQR